MAIRITDKLYSSTVEGVVADSSTIKGGYITVETITDRDSLNKNSLINGQPVYVAGENKTYRWDGLNSTWIEDNALAVSVTEHINSKSNPHEVTKSQVGLGNVDDKSVETIKTEFTGSISDGNEGFVKGGEIFTEFSKQVKNSGDQFIRGSLTLIKKGESSTGNLTVQGDLIVQGTTTTINSETLNVQDNLIVTNSSGTSLESLSGLAIKISNEDVYGITYDPIDNSIKLGVGTIDDESEEFTYNEDEGLPIVVRDDSICDNNFVLYSEDGHKIIDSEISKLDYEDKAARLGQAETNISELNSNLTQEISARTSADTTLQNNIDAEKTRAEQAENNINSLLTSEVNRAEQAEENLQSKINEEAGIRKSEDQTLQNNIDNEVSRAKEIENTLQSYIEAETTRATTAEATKSPTNHASTEATYGVGTTSNYGHVKVDDQVQDDSENPVQGKAIFNYIKRVASNLVPASDNSGSTSKTIINLKQESNGTVTPTFENIQIEQSQVSSLETSLNALATDILNEKTAREGADQTLRESLTEAISNEASDRAANDSVVLTGANSYTDTKVAELITNYNLYLLQNLPTDTSKTYVLGYNSESAKWEFSNLDEGIIEKPSTIE